MLPGWTDRPTDRTDLKISSHHKSEKCNDCMAEAPKLKCYPPTRQTDTAVAAEVFKGDS